MSTQPPQDNGTTVDAAILHHVQSKLIHQLTDNVVNLTAANEELKKVNYELRMQITHMSTAPGRDDGEPGPVAEG